ncbi:hypothetical protein IV203_019999 [Nitzschia inconspicua]|uniref:Calx-beta domain-containing protein n=1 Tax=Nitzschia inconspicua TaxID=303405 RepID=A0A9K3Q7V7_9STRA|nr:hypothetical protein IV203_019999 [Nitzschia inconspicua]
MKSSLSWTCCPLPLASSPFLLLVELLQQLWGVQNQDSNTVTISFDVSQAGATGNTGEDFHVYTEQYGGSQDNYTISAGLGAAVSTNADPLTVTFTNDIHVTDTTYCILVKVEG